MKTVCIAGGRGGMGKKIVEELEKEGYTVYIIDRKEVSATPSCDVLILNSGIGWFGELENLDNKKLEQIMWINLERHIALVKSVIKEWKKRRSGHYIFTASNSAYEGFDGNNVYSATKAGLLGFARSLAKECRRYGIKVTVISPGATNTDFWLTTDRDDRNKCKPIEPYEIAKAVSFVLKIPSEVSEIKILPMAKEIEIKNSK